MRAAVHLPAAMQCWPDTRMCADTMDKHRTGKLVEIFEKAGIKSKL